MKRAMIFAALTAIFLLTIACGSSEEPTPAREGGQAPSRSERVPTSAPAATAAPASRSQPAEATRAPAAPQSETGPQPLPQPQRMPRLRLLRGAEARRRRPETRVVGRVSHRPRLSGTTEGWNSPKRKWTAFPPSASMLTALLTIWLSVGREMAMKWIRLRCGPKSGLTPSTINMTHRRTAAAFPSPLTSSGIHWTTGGTWPASVSRPPNCLTLRRST